MEKKDIISGQHISEDKCVLARQLRQEQTNVEKILWERLRKSQLNGYHFRRQQIIAGYIVDFYCHSAGLVIELDGSVHISQQEYDAKREKDLEEIELKVIRFNNKEVEKDVDGVLEKILHGLLGEIKMD